MNFVKMNADFYVRQEFLSNEEWKKILEQVLSGLFNTTVKISEDGWCHIVGNVTKGNVKGAIGWIRNTSSEVNFIYY